MDAGGRVTQEQLPRHSSVNHLQALFKVQTQFQLVSGSEVVQTIFSLFNLISINVERHPTWTNQGDESLPLSQSCGRVDTHRLHAIKSDAQN